MNKTKTPVISLLQIEKCVFFDKQTCDFTNSPRPFHIVSYVNRGGAVFTSQSKTITLSKGDVFFIPMGATYTSEWNGGDVVYCTSVFFSFESGSDPTADKSYAIQRLEGEAGERVAELIDKLSRYKSRDQYFDYGLLGDFYCLCGQVFDALETSPKALNASVIRSALDFIEENYDKEISIKQIAELCNFSESRFHHVFKEIMGVSPIAYKHRIAVNHARLYLSGNENYTIEEISEKCGFSSSIYFRRVFKKITGKSPREYKKTSMI